MDSRGRRSAVSHAQSSALGALMLRWRALAALCLLLVLLSCSRANDEVIRRVATDEAARPGIAGMLRGDEAGFDRADRPRVFSFPADHGAHPTFRTEWWYFTGHLAGVNGERFGFQFTVFRQALGAPAGAPATAAAGRSAWRADNAWLAHLAVTDINGQQHWSATRLSRGALGLAGATASPLAVWVQDWQLAQQLPKSLDQRVGVTPWLLRARDDSGMALDLTLTPAIAPVLHGEGGLSRKGAQAASYYYSMPRWQVRGSIATPSHRQPLPITGTAWLDREWSTSALAPQQIGWDWFALRLRDGRALMLFQLRRSDGRRDSYDAGSLIAPDGAVQHLTSADFSLTPEGTWRDEQQVRWPTRWTLRLRPIVAMPRPLQITISAEVDDQLMRVGLRYWEGAVRVSGDAEGEGYLEMTGYRR